jgi:hypothetical protein
VDSTEFNLKKRSKLMNENIPKIEPGVAPMSSSASIGDKDNTSGRRGH